MNYGKHQQVTIEDKAEIAQKRSKKELESLMAEQFKVLNGLKKDIEDEDSKFKKERNAKELKKLVKQSGQQ